MTVGLGPGGRARPFGRADLRVPRTAPKERAEAPPRPKDKPSLLLSVNRGTLSIELDQSFALGPVLVDKLALSLPNVRFPVDLSGGVTRLRHKRGALTQLGLSCALPDVAALALSARTGDGLPALRRRLLDVAGWEDTDIFAHT